MVLSLRTVSVSLGVIEETGVGKEWKGMYMTKRQNIEDAIINMINRQIIKPGEQIPSIREMAKIYNVSATPVIEAYRNLEERGVLESHPRSGYTVIGQNNEDATKPEIAPSLSMRYDGKKGDYLSNHNYYTMERSKAGIVYPFGQAAAAVDLFTSEQMSRFITRSTKNYPELVGRQGAGYDDHMLVDEISKWMVQYQCIINSKEIVVTNNSMTASIMLALHACTHNGDSVAITAPGAQSHYFTVALKNLYAVPVRCTLDQGMNLDCLEQALSANPSITCLICSPNFSAPDGALMSDENKLRLIDICAKHNVTIIEDDSFGDLTHSDVRPQPLKSLAPDSIIYINSFNCTSAPGLEISWVCGGKYHEIFRDYRNAMACSPPAFIQRGFSAYLESSMSRAHMKQIQNQHREAVTAVRKAVMESFPENTQASNPSGGYYLWVKLPKRCSSLDLFHLAQQCKISISPGVLYSSHGEYADCFRLNCSIVSNRPEMLEGIYTLGKLAGKLVSLL